MSRLAFGIAAFLATSGTAMAGEDFPVLAVPADEAGAGIAAMAALGLGLAWLRRRKSR